MSVIKPHVVETHVIHVTSMSCNGPRLCIVLVHLYFNFVTSHCVRDVQSDERRDLQLVYKVLEVSNTDNTHM